MATPPLPPSPRRAERPIRGGRGRSGHNPRGAAHGRYADVDRWSVVAPQVRAGLAALCKSVGVAFPGSNPGPATAGQRDPRPAETLGPGVSCVVRVGPAVTERLRGVRGRDHERRSRRACSTDGPGAVAEQRRTTRVPGVVEHDAQVPRLGELRCRHLIDVSGFASRRPRSTANSTAVNRIARLRPRMEGAAGFPSRSRLRRRGRNGRRDTIRAGVPPAVSDQIPKGAA